jgi:alkylation response protein AidB-like acyl-CoA dehydrogenase
MEELMQPDAWMQLAEEIGPTFAANADARDANDVFVADHYPVLRERGLVSMMVPEELGGGGASHSTVCRVLATLARYDASTALALSMHQHLLAAQVFNHRAGNARATKLLARVAKDRLVLVSTGARDWLESNGKLEREEQGYRLTADKAFASGCLAGDIAVTSAPYEHPTEGWQVLHFAVPLTAGGVRIGDDWVAHGMRATGSHTIHFESVFVPDEAISLARPRGLFHPVWSVVLTVAMPLISSVYVGIAQQAADAARKHARRRSADVATQLAVGQMDTSRIAAEATLDAMIRLANDLAFAPSVEITNRVLALKTATIEAAQASVDFAVEAAGGAGFYRKNAIERHLRDVRAGDFHPLPPNAQRLFAGRVGLGLEPVAAG